MEKKGLKPLGITLVVLAALAVIIIGFVIFTPHTSTGKTIFTTSSVGTSFSNSPYYPYAYLISTPTLSSDAQEAITGFQLNTTSNSDGSTTYILTALKQSYYNQTYTIQPGQQLYFIERSMGDDNVADNDDYNLGDDFAIVVDSSGNIVQGPPMMH